MKYIREFDYSGLTGKVITREDFDYEEERKAWNRAIEKYPLVIVFCVSKIDVVNAINWGRLNLVEIRIRNGRHNYEGYSTGNDVIVIDISEMNHISVDEEKSMVNIQGGVTNRKIYETLGKLGYLFPGGGCPTVGVSGLTLGGGWGYSNRLLGLTCDSLLELEMIDYNGETIIANNETNKDLFWACMGAGGGNFGIIVSMTFKLIKKIKMVTLIDIDYVNAKFEEMIEIFKRWVNLFKNLDRRINLKMSIYNSKIKGKGVRIIGLFYGSGEEADMILKPFKNLTEDNVFSLEYITVLEANRKIQDSHPPFEKYKSSGRFVYKEYNRSEMKDIINLVSEREDGSIYTAVTLYGMGGAIMNKSRKETAFYYRDAKFIM